MSLLGMDQLPVLAQAILDFSQGRKLFVLYGEMGSGKTTLIKELCRQLGSSDHFSSPTYAIANEYWSPLGKIFHLDLYRLKNTEEALAIGVEEYIDGANYCFVEWPDIIHNLLPPDPVHIQIKTDGEVRNVSIFTEPKL